MKPYNLTELKVYRSKLIWERETYKKHQRYFIFKNKIKFFDDYVTRISNVYSIMNILVKK